MTDIYLSILITVFRKKCTIKKTLGGKYTAVRHLTRFCFFFQGRDDRVQQERRDHDAKRLPDDPLQNHRHEKVHAARGARQVSLM